MTEQARAVRRFVERRPPRRPQRTGHYVVAAGKGGVGTSTTALLLALAARGDGPVVLVDAHAGLAGLDHMMAVPDPAEDEGVRTTPVAEGLTLVHEGGPDPATRAPTRRAALRRAARSDDDALVIVDAGAHPASVLEAVTDFGGTLITVVAPDGASAPAAYALAKLAWRHRPETPVTALANRAGEEQAQLLHEALRSGALKFASRSIHWAGRLPEAPSLIQAETAWWQTLQEDEPALWRAVRRAWRRIRQPDPSRTNPTLTLWE